VIGRLRHLLVIEAREETDDGAGGVAVAWTPIGQAWARLEPTSGREGVNADRETALRRWRITLRYRDDVSPAHRFAHGSRHFDIETIVDPNGRRRFLICDCNEEEGT
jgi:SPP1 family predicted phage head-tail adaptor